MPNTYSQLHIHLVFAVKYREALIRKDWQQELHKYITGIFERNNHKLLQINSMPDHIHILVGLNPHQSISAIVQNIKSESTKWINAKKFCKRPFYWQEGYGAFSYSRSQVSSVIRYIKDQEIHHKKATFLEEYQRMLSLFEVDFKEQYIFSKPEESSCKEPDKSTPL